MCFGNMLAVGNAILAAKYVHVLPRDCLTYAAFCRPSHFLHSWLHMQLKTMISLLLKQRC